uniref:Uncharacterized protein n=1 Tax=Oryza glaberrima TaxID=4538 RepID=I1QFC7_ORYGL
MSSAAKLVDMSSCLAWCHHLTVEWLIYLCCYHLISLVLPRVLHQDMSVQLCELVMEPYLLLIFTYR